MNKLVTRKSRTRPKICGYKKLFVKRLDGTWEWECPIWFTYGMFANVWVKGTKSFSNEELCRADMEENLKLFGITKRTPMA